jgi:nucleolysin TIA-1/TIAR
MDRGVVSSDVNKSPTSIGDTTDEEDNISLSHFNNSTTTNDNTTSSGRTASTHLRPSSVSSSGSINPPPIATPSSSSDSYFLSSHHHLHHHHQTASANEATDATARSLGRSPTTHRARSPLIAPELSNSASNTLDAGVGGVGGWDYSETEWWGWIILLVTWLVFVVGIGSSFGVWSWAWDVGETPYAPPELEDDPTLPIVGYYPALMVLTAVMAWVWVVVAWVGMKYFKHANIAADDR